MIKKLFFTVLAILLAIIFALCIVEAAMWLVAPRFPQYFNFPQDCAASAPGMGYRYKPNCAEGFVKTNRAGFRDYVYPKMKPRGTRRVVCLGDSYTAATTVAFDAAYPKVMERMLRKRTGGKTDVLNMGVYGYDTTQALEFYRRIAKDYQPDVVALGIYLGNDIYDNVRDYRYGTLDGSLVTWPTNPAKYWKKRIGLSSRLYRWYKLRKKRIAAPGGKPAPEPTVNGYAVGYLNYHAEVILKVMRKDSVRDPFWQARWKKTFECLYAFQRETARHGTKFIAVVMPAEVQVAPRLFDTVMKRSGLKPADYDPALPDRLIVEYCKKNGMACIDLLPDLIDASKTAPTYGLNMGHWNDYGNRVVAERIGSYIGSNFFGLEKEKK